MKLKHRKWEGKRIVAAAMGFTLLAAVFFALPQLRKTEEEQPIIIRQSDLSPTDAAHIPNGSDSEKGGGRYEGAGDGDGKEGGSDDKTEKGEGVLTVDVDGAVKKPGVVTVKEGDRVFQALELAGGLSEKADTSSVNLARLVEDGEKIYVPSRSEASGATPSPDDFNAAKNSASPSGARININQATAAQLQQLPGIGPATAEKILEYRRQNGSFHKVEELKNVSGIGEKTFARFRDKISI